MTTAPARGPVNGEESGKPVELRKRALDAAIEAALPAPVPAAAEPVWPQVAFFAARERPKLHKSLPSEYELIWGIRLGAIVGEGQGVGFTCAQGMPARNLAAALRTCADRLDEIAECVELKLEVPAFDPARIAARNAERLAQLLGLQSAAAAPVDKSETGVSSHGPEGQGTTSPGGTAPDQQA